MMRLEIACFTPESAIIASSGGADRIEFCDGHALGGTTPNLKALQDIKRQVSTIPVNVMIRPRGGDFLYSPAEFATMSDEIDTFKPFADGFVFGILSSDGCVDVERCKELVVRASPLPCTFHRAFDETRDMRQALDDVATCGFTTILSSGGHDNAVLGADALAGLVEKGSALGVVVMPGGGVRSSNIAELVRKTGAIYYHSSAIVDGTSTADVGEIKALKTNCRREAARI